VLILRDVLGWPARQTAALLKRRVGQQRVAAGPDNAEVDVVVLVEGDQNQGAHRRRFATAFPEVEEFTHFRFRLPGFEVRGKPFAGVEKGETTAVFAISQEEAAAVADDTATYEEVWRTAAMKIFVGLRVDLAKVPEERVQELVEHAWRNKAPKRVVAAYDAQ
jgi:hypothetical protein